MANVNVTNFVNEGTYSSTDFMGYTFVPNGNVNVTLVTKIAAVSPVRARILDSSYNELVAANFSGNTATFASPYAVVSGTTYRVVVDSSGSSFTASYKNDYNLPSNNTDLNFTAITYYNGTWHTNTSGSPISGIESLTTDVSASGPANLKSYNTNLKANVKSMNTNLIANVKSFDTNV